MVFPSTSISPFSLTSTPGSFFKKGDCLAKYLSYKNLNNEQDINKIIFEQAALKDGYVINHTATSNVSEGMEIFQVLENSYEEILDSNS